MKKTPWKILFLFFALSLVTRAFADGTATGLPGLPGRAGGGTSGAVTAVTATSPLVSSGGTTPNISFDGGVVLSVTATSPLVSSGGANPNIAIDGGFVQSVTASGPLISSGGANPNISIDGGWTLFGTTGQRPASVAVGQMYFDTTLNIPIWWNGTNWVDASGTIS